MELPVGQHRSDDPGGTRSTQGCSRHLHGCARGEDIVDDEDRRWAGGARCQVGPLQSLDTRSAGLALAALALQLPARRQTQVLGDPSGDLVGLVEPPTPKVQSRRRYPGDQIGRLVGPRDELRQGGSEPPHGCTDPAVLQ